MKGLDVSTGDGDEPGLDDDETTLMFRGVRNRIKEFLPK